LRGPRGFAASQDAGRPREAGSQSEKLPDISALPVVDPPWATAQNNHAHLPSAPKLAKRGRVTSSIKVIALHQNYALGC
jgi:hypothetical protein